MLIAEQKFFLAAFAELEISCKCSDEKIHKQEKRVHEFIVWCKVIPALRYEILWSVHEEIRFDVLNSSQLWNVKLSETQKLNRNWTSQKETSKDIRNIFEGC